MQFLITSQKIFSYTETEKVQTERENKGSHDALKTVTSHSPRCFKVIEKEPVFSR